MPVLRSTRRLCDRHCANDACAVVHHCLPRGKPANRLIGLQHDTFSIRSKYSRRNLRTMGTHLDSDARTGLRHICTPMRLDAVNVIHV